MSAGTAFTTIRTEGAILPPDILSRIAAADKDLGGLNEAAYHLTGEKFGEATNRAWNRLQSAWLNFQTARQNLPPGDAGTTITRERWLLPLFQFLDYGRLQISKAQEIGGKTYAISHAWQNVPIHLVGCNVDLESRHRGTSPHSLLQEFLNRSEGHLWGIASNGLRLRLLRDNISLTRQAYVEFDLEAMMAGEAYPDFVLLWLLLHQSRFEGERPELAWIEKWSQAARTEGVRVLDGLRDGVQRAIESQPDMEAIRIGLNCENHFDDQYREILYSRTPILQEPPENLDETWRHGIMLNGGTVNEYLELARNYRQSAEALLASALEDGEPRAWGYPVLYAYRHALELYLKLIGEIEERTHSLKDCVRLVEKRHGEKLPPPIKQWIVEFDEIDPHGTGFRYADDESGTLNAAEFWIDFVQLKFAMSRVFETLDSAILRSGVRGKPAAKRRRTRGQRNSAG